jgi:hypothetical protein
MNKMFKSFLKENVSEIKNILIKRFVDEEEDEEDELRDEINSIYKFESDGFGGYYGVGEDGGVELGYSIVEDKSRIKEDEVYKKIKIKDKECYMILFNL